MADDIQEIVMEDGVVWPKCPQQIAGLHPDLDEGTAVWFCRVGSHVIAAIGELRRGVDAKGVQWWGQLLKERLDTSFGEVLAVSEELNVCCDGRRPRVRTFTHGRDVGCSDLGRKMTP